MLATVSKSKRCSQERGSNAELPTGSSERRWPRVQKSKRERESNTKSSFASSDAEAVSPDHMSQEDVQKPCWETTQLGSWSHFTDKRTRTSWRIANRRRTETDNTRITQGPSAYPVHKRIGSPVQSEAPRGKEGADNEKTHDKQSWAAAVETVPDVRETRGRESLKGRSLRSCLSRGVPAEHEARSQVKVEEKSSAVGRKALTGGLTRSDRRIQKRGDARVHEREKQRAKRSAQAVRCWQRRHTLGCDG